MNQFPPSSLVTHTRACPHVFLTRTISLPSSLLSLSFHLPPISTSLPVRVISLRHQGTVALAGDFSAGKMIFGVEGVDPERRARLVELLDIDLDWSMMTVSDGQRRRVQICMGLLRPFKVLLCDEITVDLDILGRLDLLAFLAEECETRGATVVYATHIFDGMENWMTHIAFASNGELRYGGAKETIPGLRGVRHLLSTIDQWLRVDRDERRVREAKEALEPKKPPGPKFESRHMAYYR